MIRVTVELISAVHPSRNKVLGTAVISNITGNSTRATYRYGIWGQRDKLMHEGLLENIPRKQTNAWDLLTLALATSREKILKRKLGIQ